MPAQANRDLYLQVGGDVSNLKAAMKDGRSSLLDLVAAAREAQGETNQALRDISADPAALKQLVGAYDQTFAAIRRNAQAAMSANDNTSALKIIDAAGAQQQAAAIAAQAAQLRIAADAAAAVAERQGEAGVAARVLAAALEVQAVDAAKVAAAMRGQADVLAEVAQEAKMAGASEDELSGGHNRMGASGMIAEHVIRSLSASIAAGQSPIRTVTMEMGRITEALTMFAQTTGETKGMVGALAGFMGGPWGLAMSVAVAVLVPLVAELFEMHDAAKLAELGNDGLAEAQGALGKMFDLTSGKLNKQNSLLRLNAELTAVNLRAKATEDKTKSDATFGALGTSSWSNFFSMQHFGDEVGAAPRQLIGMVRSGRIDPAEAARRAQTVDMTGSKVSREDFMTALGQMVGSQYETKGADDIETALRTGKLPDELKNPVRDKKPHKPKVDHTAEREANKDRAYQSELGTAQDKLAKAQLALADTAQGRYKLEADELDAAKVQRDLEIDDEVTAKKITAEQAAKLKALNRDTTELEKQAAQRTLDSYVVERAHKLTQDSLDAQIALDQIDEQMATTRQARLDLERKLLREREKKDLDAQQAILDDPKSTVDQKADATAAQGRIRTNYDAQGKALEQQNLDPFAAYGQQLHRNTDDMNDALKNVEVGGLKGVEDGLAGIIDGSETAAQAFKKMASSIISDLARIAIEKALVSIFGFNTGGEVGSVTPQAHAGGGVIVGAGSGTSDSILSWLSNGEFVMNAEATRKHLPLLHAMNDNALPGFATGGLVGSLSGMPSSYPALPRPDELRSHSRVDVAVHNTVEPSPLFDVRSHAIAQQTVTAAAQPIMMGATSQTMKKLRRQPLPGGYA